MTPTADDLESPFFLIHGRGPLEGCSRLLGPGSIRDLGNTKDSSSLLNSVSYDQLTLNPCKKTGY